jgi:formate dehydrogenase assembly factor FdhD
MGLEVTREIWTLTGETSSLRTDALAVEEPLEIRVNSKAISTTMRTPGHDLALRIWMVSSLMPTRRMSCKFDCAMVSN